MTVDAILGIYRRTPDRFPPIDSPEDKQAQIGQVKVIHAEHVTCLAEAITQFPQPLPAGARARMIKPGQSEQLRVRLDQAEPNPAPVLAASPLLAIMKDDDLMPEVWVNRTAEGWEISNDTNRALARLRLNLPADPAQHRDAIEQAYWALRNGLESYARYNLVLRLAKSCSDPELDQSILATLHDCSDAATLQHVDPKRPSLPELPRNASRIYEVPARMPYCIRLANVYWQTLYLTVFNCTAYGMVEFLGEVGIQREDVETLWLGGVQRTPFKAVPDNPKVETVDRIIVIATTRPGVNLRGLEVRDMVQQVIDQTLRQVRGSGTREARLNADLWTAVTVPLKIGREH